MSNQISMSTIFPNEEKDLNELVQDLQPKIDFLVERELKKYGWTERVNSQTSMIIRKEVLQATIQDLYKEYNQYINSETLTED